MGSQKTMNSLADVKLSVRIFTEIPGVIRNLLEDIQHDPLTQKMLYILYNMSGRFVTYRNIELYRWSIFEVCKGDMDWIEFQCVINCLIVHAT